MQQEILLDILERQKRIEAYIQDVVAPIPSSPTLKEIIDTNEVCDLTGLDRQTVYQLKYEGKIPHFKFGKRLLRFRRSQILVWMENRND